MDNLYVDIILLIFKELTLKDKLTLCLCNKYLDSFKYKIKFNNEVNISKILGLEYFDQFMNFIIFNNIGSPIKLPKINNKYIFCKYFDQPINNCIPNTVNKLTFGNYFNQSIKLYPKFSKKI